jgi:type I restriction enzyme S subunit
LWNWKQKKLGDVFIGKKGQGLSKKDVVKNGKDKCILYGELYTRYSEVIKEVYRIIQVFLQNLYNKKKIRYCRIF